MGHESQGYMPVVIISPPVNISPFLPSILYLRHRRLPNQIGEILSQEKKLKNLLKYLYFFLVIWLFWHKRKIKKVQVNIR